MIYITCFEVDNYFQANLKEASKQHVENLIYLPVNLKHVNQSPITLIFQIERNNNLTIQAPPPIMTY